MRLQKSAQKRGMIGVELLRYPVGDGDQLNLVLVEDVDQPDEAPRSGRHFRNSRDPYLVIAACQFQVVILRAWAAAQRLEVEPDHSVAAAQRSCYDPRVM
jgi:hypothetical protein